ncbi:Lar family restriction alleviation protein [Paraburkholderia bannensis]|uniref:Lar family restriction alleviation protein n=1 Tax=Paraburkholderia bannensis TaxID=765414 RepID=UPI002AB63D8D|nr:Lar family restriction alleviation protein [Paraburkholderia bannensis]
MDAKELKPCPFCGGTEQFVERLDYSACYVQCDSPVGDGEACCMRGPIGVQDGDGEEMPGRDAAIRAWNERAALPSDAAQAPISAWQTGTPPVPEGECHEFIIAVRRVAVDKTLVYSANYANKFTDDGILSDRDGEEFVANGWYHIGLDMSGEFNEVYEAIDLSDGDAVVGWQELPKWSDAAPVAPAAAAPITNEQLGAIKWAADRAHVESLGKPISGVERRRWHILLDFLRTFAAASVAGAPTVIGSPAKGHLEEPETPSDMPFQARVQPWMMECFGAEISADRAERNHRFFEEATELVQACGMTASEAHQLVDYTFGRPVGEPHQEVGGVMVTLAALCLANSMDMHTDGETELARITRPDMVIRIRAKQASKPKHSPLPAVANPTEQRMSDAARDAVLTDLQRDTIHWAIEVARDAGAKVRERVLRGLIAANPITAHMSDAARECEWTYDDVDFKWDSVCGESWVFNDDGPVENKVRFCHGCGGRVTIAARKAEIERSGGDA